MKLKICVPLLGIFAVLSSAYAIASANLVVISKPVIVPVKDPNLLPSITAKQFLSLTTQKLQELTGKKMSMMQRIEFRMLQHKVKKMMNRGEVITLADVIKRSEDPNLMNIAGVLLGALLGPVGVIIALLLKENGHMSQTAFHWSLIGLAIFIVWFLILIA